MKRRDFLFDFSFLTAALSLTSCQSNPLQMKDSNPQKRLAFFTVYSPKSDDHYGMSPGGLSSIGILNPANSHVSFHPTPLQKPHGLAQHPLNPDILVVAPKDYSVALVLNISTGQVVQRMELKNEENFYGHGFFTRDGERLFLSGYQKNGMGFLREYDRNWNVVGNLETFGRAPHDAKTVENGNVILVANNGWTGLDSIQKEYVTSMTYIDLKTRRLIEKIELLPGHLAFQHFVANEAGDFVVGCDYLGVPEKEKVRKQSLVAYRKRNKPLEFLSAPEAFLERTQGNILSIAWDEETRTVVTTTPEGPVTFWDLDQMKATHQVLDRKFPHGVVVDRQQTWITTANEGIWTSSLDRSQPETNVQKLSLPQIQNLTAHSIWII